MSNLKTMLIKGKEYVTVAERVRAFNELYPKGSIETYIVDKDENTITFRAIVRPNSENKDRCFIGHAHEDKRNILSMVNKTSHVENAETSAVGRALAMMGIGIVEGIASADEVIKAQKSQPKVGEKVTISETEKIIIPKCSSCGEAMFRAKRKNGVKFWCCPNWKGHKDNGEKSEPIWEKEPEIINQDGQPF